ncbi:MAG: hypothetical protein ACI4GA_03050, partial [Acutalibacteraceae bacterium]
NGGCDQSLIRKYILMNGNPYVSRACGIFTFFIFFLDEHKITPKNTKKHKKYSSKYSSEIMIFSAAS